MRAFVTGGAGFIGSHLVDRLIEDGAEVTVYDDLSSGKKEFISRHERNSRFKFIKADLLDLNKLKDAVRGHDIVFHLAANPDIRYGIEHTDTDLKQNTIVTYNVLESMRQAGIKEMVFASTSAVYGEPSKMPTREDYGPLFPISLYGASKLACEAMCTAFSHSFGIKCWIFRFANIIGGRGTHGVIFDFINKLQKDPKELEILGNGKQTKSYLLVDDCVDAILFVQKKAKDQFNLFNLGTNDRIDITTIAKALTEKMVGSGVKLKFSGGERGWPGDVTQMSLDVSKLQAFGWKSRYNCREAVDIAIERMLKECRR